jgi:alkanesulfonate monooxygenase SsuD/methylene tetrahydromethanopterin reductase-like flavin-dependent oxidoreductase (luciferase family)
VAPPLRTDLPIYMAGVNPRMVEAAGAVSDGLVGHPLFTREYVAEVVRPALARGAERAGRAAPVPIAGYVTCSVNDDADQARRDAAAIVAFNASVRTYAPIIALHGFEPEAEAIRAGFKAGDWGAMTDAVSDRMLDTVALAGTPREVREQFHKRRAGVFERTLLWPPATGGFAAAEELIEAFRA